MASDLTVSFGGDASQLNATIAQARQAIATFSPGATGTAASGLAALSASLASARAQADQTRSSFLQMVGAVALGNLAADAVKKAATAYASYAEAATRATVAAATFVRNTEFSPIVAEYNAIKALDTGLLHYVTSAAYAQRGTEMFTVANQGLAASIGRTVIAVEETFTRWPSIIQHAIDAVNAFRVANLTGDTGDTLGLIAQAGQFQAFTAAVDNAAANARAKMAQLTSDYQKTMRSMTGVDDPSPDDSSGAADTSAITSKYQADMAKAADGVKDIKQVVDSFLAQLQKIPGMSDDAAVKIEAAFGSVPGYTVAANDAMVQYLQSFAKTSDEAVAMTTKITGAFKDADNGAKTLSDIVLAIKPSPGQIEVAKDFGKALSASLNPAQAQSFMQLVQAGLQRQLDTVRAQDTQQQGIVGRITGQHAANLKNIDDIQQQMAIVEVLFQNYKGITDQLREQTTLQAALNQSTATSRREDFQDQNKTLQAGLATRKSSDDADVSDADKTLAIQTAILEAGKETDQGIIAVLNSMYNRLNAGYGNYGDTLGSVIQKPSAYSGVDSAGGAFDPSKAASVSTSSYQYQRVLQLWNQSLFGDDSIADPTGGATHYYANSIATPYWAKGMNNQKTIGNQTFGNPDGPPVMSGDNATKAAELIQTNNDGIREQNNLIAGGTAAEKQQLDVLSQKANGSQDAVKAAQSALDVAKQQLAVTGQIVNENGKVASDPSKSTAASPTAQTKAAQDYYNAVNALAEANVAREKAMDDLKTANTIEGTKERLDAQIAGFDHDIAAAKGDATQIANIERQKTEAIRAYNKQAAEDATTTENEKYEAAKRSLEDQMAAMKAAQAEGSLSALQVLDQTKSIQNQELNLEQAHLAKLVGLWAQFPNEYRKYQGQLSAISSQRRSEDLAAELKYQEEIVNAYRQHFDQIASTVASSLSAILERTGNWRDLLRNIAKSVEQQFISSSLKMAADWAVDRTKDVVVTEVTEAQKTAATMAGNAARTASGVAADGEAALSAVRAFATTIAADAKATFAGVFAFLSPIMGPLAAGPAAAASATVASYDVGAWSLPADQLALVHKNEMIIPAGPAQAFRDAIAGGGGGGGGNVTHNWGGITVNNPKSGLDIVDAIRSNARAINRALATTPSGR